MKKILLTTLTVVFAFSLCMAQDVILLSTGNDLEVRVLEINQDEIKYKMYDSLEGPTFTMLRSDAWMVRYEDGEQLILKPQENTNKVAATDTKNTTTQAKTEAAAENDKPVTIVGKGLHVIFSPIIKYVTAPDSPAKGSDTNTSTTSTGNPDNNGGQSKVANFWISLGLDIGFQILSDYLSHGSVSVSRW